MKKKLDRINPIVIGITGSYGKTTMKDALKLMLEGSRVVLSSKENQNTPMGISRLILDELTDETEVFVVEMGAYYRGDIKNLCKIVQPDISIA